MALLHGPHDCLRRTQALATRDRQSLRASDAAPTERALWCASCSVNRRLFQQTVI